MTRRLLALAALLAPIPSAPAADSPAVEYAKKDVARATALVQAATTAAQATNDDPRLVAVRAAAAAKASVDQLAANATKAVATAEAAVVTAQAALDKAVADVKNSETSMAKAKAAMDAAAKASAAATSARQTVAEALKLAEADLAAATAAKNAKATSLRTILVDAARTRLAAADQSAASARTALDASTKTLTTATATVEAAKKAAATRTAQREAATKTVAAAKTEQARVKTLVDQAEKLLKDVTEHAKPAAETQKKSQAAIEAAKQRLATFTARLAKVSAKAPAFDPKNVHQIASFKMPRPAVSCRFDGEAATILAGAQHTDLVRWNLHDGMTRPMPGHRTWIRRVDVDPELVVSGDYSGRIAWWNPREETPRPQRTVEAHEGYVRGVAISPDRRFVATGGNDGLVRIWDAATGNKLAELDAHLKESKVLALVGKPDEVFVNHVYNVMFDPTGRFLVTGDLVGVLKLWEVGTWKHVRDFDAGDLHKYDTSFRAHCGGIRGLDISPDGKRIAAAGIANVTNAFAGIGTPCVVVFELETGKKLAVLKPAKAFRGTCWAVRFHPSGEWLVGAGGGSSGSLWFWKPTEPKSFFDYKTPNVAYDVDMHPDGLRMAVALYDSTVRLYDLLPPPPKPAPKKK